MLASLPNKANAADRLQRRLIRVDRRKSLYKNETPIFLSEEEGH